MGRGILLLILLICGSARGASLEIPSPDSADPARQDVSVEAKDGLVTGTFSVRADDATLRTAVPYLIAMGIQSVSLRGAPVQDLRPLAKMTGLKALDISGTLVQDLTPLAGLTGIGSLDLQFLRIRDLRPLAALTRLRVLNLGGTEVRDLAPLAGLAALRELAAAVTKVRDLTPLAALHELTSLNLGSTWADDLRPLAGMTNLRFLSLNGTPVDDIRPLEHLVTLRSLDLGGTQVSDVQPLAGLHELRSLNLEGTLVADVAPLAGLTALRSVAVGGSQIRDMAPLARLAMAPADQPNPPAVDPVIVWNDLTNRAIQTARADAFQASRALAMESIAVLDTIKSLDGTPAFLVRLPPPRDIPVNVAAAAAAHAVLIHLFPTRRAFLDAALAAAVMNEPAGPAFARAMSFGEAVADAVIMVRDEDGSMAAAGPRSGDPAQPGQWRPTSPGFLPPAHPQWATIHPFAMIRPEQFRPAGPPALDSEAFRQARAQVETIGGARSTTRTADQTDIAHYWSDAIGTYAPAGHWNAIAANIAAPLRLGIGVEAELFAELNVAIADAGIAMADTKYTYWFWRPITAIQDGDAVTPPATNWAPLLETPNHPSYISGHSTFSGAAATVLTAWFGDRPFTFSSASLPGLTRHFTSFQQAAEEAAASRVYGGIHFPFDNADGLATGRAVGAWTMKVFERLAEDRGPTIMLMDRSVPTAAIDPHAAVGCAFDNISPLTTVTVRLDGGPPFTVSVDDRGLFTVPAERIGSARHHAVILTATSATGRSSTMQAEFD